MMSLFPFSLKVLSRPAKERQLVVTFFKIFLFRRGYIFGPFSAYASRTCLFSIYKPMSYSTYSDSFKSFHGIVPDIA